ncbi:MAG: hypothetical protein KKG09_01520 [Verrucomicrobia bacterium]|nr:hypothetical protein [Verrucomicrobiota bacterium]MBU4248334.1 hypothetical protein [Verrucomicrobiota bacterium]MBU4291843.1 hypothetical protein [Verrucomicrobiota bacterium]MBU4496672.1 hypothetical protein [Verrucomicrobiota bacterium]MCG2680577.1 hypothetical protein [Kiritimatiellia bacterium]
MNQFIEKLIGRMSLAEKIGSVMTLGFSGVIVTPRIYEFIEQFHCGGLRLSPSLREFGSYIDPKTGKIVVQIDTPIGYRKGGGSPTITCAQYRDILAGFQRAALHRRHGIPLFFSWDHEGGGVDNWTITDIPRYPSQMGIRAAGDPHLAYEIAYAVARVGRAIGFNFIHSPILDLNINPLSPDCYTRSFSDRVEDVIEYGEAYCKGFRDGRMIAAGKHFPGQGDCAVDSHYELPVNNIDMKILRERNTAPYKAIIDQGLLPAMMIHHAVYPALDEKDVATVSKKVLTGFIRETLGFQGVITTDSITMAGVAVRYGVPQACAKALEAGADLVLLKAENHLVEDAFAEIRKAIEAGRITEEALNDKLRRVLTVKYDYGLFGPDSIAPENLVQARQASRADALVELAALRTVLVARDRRRTLPLSPQDRILVIEQIVETPNDITYHPCMLFRKCLDHARQVELVEIAFTADAGDRERVRNALARADAVVMTNYYSRGKLSNPELVNDILQAGNKKLVLVTNVPYPLAIPDNADTVVVTFSRTPQNLEVVAGTLFGTLTPEGQWPIAYRLPE